MRVTVEYTAQLKAATGTGRDSFDLPDGTSLHSLAGAVVSARPEARSILLGTDGQPHPSILVFVDDGRRTWDAGEPLADGAVVTLVSPISGG